MRVRAVHTRLLDLYAQRGLELLYESLCAFKQECHRAVRLRLLLCGLTRRARCQDACIGGQGKIAVHDAHPRPHAGLVCICCAVREHCQGAAGFGQAHGHHCMQQIGVNPDIQVYRNHSMRHVQLEVVARGFPGP